MSGVRTREGARWRRQGGGPEAAVAAVVVLAIALALGRADVAVLGAPLAAVAVLALRRPSGTSSIRVQVGTAERPGALRAQATVDAAAAADLVVVRASAYEEPPVTVVVTPGRARDLLASLPVLHSGPQEVLRVSAEVVTAGAGSVQRVEAVAARITVRPAPERLGAPLLPPRLSGRPGAHPARRLGDGTEFRDLHEFAPGDRLRRIDWRATARSGSPDTLVVRRTEAMAETTAVIALDSRDDVGARVAEWGRDRPAWKGTSSLDVARPAVGAIAAAYVEAGDRVAFHDLVHRGGGVPTGAGRRQLERIRAAAAETIARPEGLPRAPTIPSGAIVFLLSTFLDDDIAGTAALWRSAGHAVVAVDLLPQPRFDDADEPQRQAFRIIALEHASRLGRLRGLGALVIPWSDPQRDVLLREASRKRGRP